MRIPNTLVIVSAGAEVRSDTSRLARNANIVKLIKMLQAQADSAAVMTPRRRGAGEKSNRRKGDRDKNDTQHNILSINGLHSRRHSVILQNGVYDFSAIPRMSF